MVVHDYMRQIVDTHIGRPLPDPLAISAKALFHGAKPFQDRERWPLSKRLDLLHAILNIPITFQLSVIVGFCRNVPEEDTGLEPRKAIANRHARAFVVCTLAAEQFMRAETASRRVATMIVENNTDTKQAIKETQRMMRTPPSRCSGYSRTFIGSCRCGKLSRIRTLSKKMRRPFCLLPTHVPSPSHGGFLVENMPKVL